MKNKINNFLSFSNEDIIMCMLACLSFSGGIWSNYRQLWLEKVLVDIPSVSRVLSVSLICGAAISFLISIFSKKVSIKDIVMLSILYRVISFIYLFFLKDIFWIKVFVLLGVMSDVIFSISIWPLIATINKSNKAYKKHILINYFSKDLAVIMCAFLFGNILFNHVFDLDDAMFIALIANIFGIIFMLFFKNNSVINSKEKSNFKKSINSIFRSLTSKYYLFTQFISNVTYGMIFDLMMIILTKYIDFSISFASIFIIISNLLGSIFSSYFAKKSDNISVSLSVIIKYGIRTFLMILSVICNNIYVYIISIIVIYISSRILDDKVNGTYLNRIDNDNMFLYGNLRYFVVCFGEGIGVYLAGILLNQSLRLLFISAIILLIIQTALMINLDFVRIKEDN